MNDIVHIIVFGWFQNSFIGMEQESAYSQVVGYLKGTEQAGTDARLVLNVMLMIRPKTDNHAGMSSCTNLELYCI